VLAVQGDGNNVVYDRGQPVWDSWGYEAGRRDWPSPSGQDRPAPPTHEAPPPAPAPNPPDVRPPSGSGGFALDRLVCITAGLPYEAINRGYAYWSQAVIMGSDIYTFAGMKDGAVHFFRVSTGGRVEHLGPLLPYGGEGEGWYFDAQAWVYLLDGPRLRRVNPFTGEDRVIFSVEEIHPGCDLWQAHSSDDGQTHSATVRDAAHPDPNGRYPYIGTVVFRRGRQDFFDAHGDLDESTVSGDGTFVIIQENNDNRVINLQSRETRTILDRERALAHVDTGPDFMIGEADKPDPGACVIWNLRDLNRGPRILFLTTGMGHVSVRNSVCLVSDDTHLSLVSLDGGSFVPFLRHGMIGNDYDHQVMANLDPSGRICAFMSNRAGGRMDLYLAPVPR
jgi:hypothetical protein